MALVDQFNRDTAEWTRQTKQKAKLQILKLTKQYSGHARKDFDAKTKKYHGEASKIDFKMPYYMAFVHKGAGRGYGGSKTGLFTRSSGVKGTTKESSKGKMGTGKRLPKPWFNPVLEERFPALADLVATYHGEKVILNVQKILIR